MEQLLEFFKNDRYAAHSGIELLEASPGQARARLAIDERHLNGIGTIHGGVIFTLADLAFAMAANSHGTVAVALNVNISFLRAVSSGVLYATAREISLGPKIATYEVLVTDQDEQLVASFQGMAYRKQEPLPGC